MKSILSIICELVDCFPTFRLTFSSECILNLIHLYLCSFKVSMLFNLLLHLLCNAIILRNSNHNLIHLGKNSKIVKFLNFQFYGLVVSHEMLLSPSYIGVKLSQERNSSSIVKSIIYTFLSVEISWSRKYIYINLKNT